MRHLEFKLTSIEITGHNEKPDGNNHLWKDIMFYIGEEDFDNYQYIKIDDNKYYLSNIRIITIEDNRYQPNDCEYIKWGQQFNLLLFELPDDIDEFDINKLEIHCNDLYLFNENHRWFEIKKLIYDGVELENNTQDYINVPDDYHLYQYKDGEYIGLEEEGYMY